MADNLQADISNYKDISRLIMINDKRGGTAAIAAPDTAEAQHGFGLRGTIERIRYYCDSTDVVQIRSEPGEFTEIEIIVPQMKKEESENVSSHAD